MYRAHPRSRGENRRVGVECRWRAGSSPLTRGKPIQTTVDVYGHRLIPAHAGKTQAHQHAYHAQPAHPRSRGENTRRASTCCSLAGSSPLTRGKRIAKIAERRLCRLIPAHAGKTRRPPGGWSRGEAHPRSRGENPGLLGGSPTNAGSSPLTRGKHYSGYHAWGWPGLIPAHAGKTMRERWSNEARQAHPRSRGENPTAYRGNAANAGSSPLTRGKLQWPTVGGFAFRLIPAHAGKTTAASTGWPTSRAHPRSRGENRPVWEATRPDCGSSPLTRGKPSPQARDWAPDRLIPAHAGKTHTMTLSVSLKRAHPRSRGENCVFR